MAPTISRISFVLPVLFFVLPVSASVGDPPWRQRLEAAAGASQAAARAASPEAAHDLASAGQGALTGERSHRGLSSEAAVMGKERARHPYEFNLDDHRYDTRRPYPGQRESRPLSNKFWFTLGLGLVGALSGGLIGALGGPVGIAVGAVLGAAVGGYIGSRLGQAADGVVDYINRW